MTSDDRSDSIELARRMAHLAQERRGTDVVLLDVRALIDYADAFLIVTGQSARQNLAIAEHVVRAMKAEHHYAISKSGLDSGSWICLDLGDVVVHVFDPETRARYDLELLWADAPRVDLGPATAPVPLENEVIDAPTAAQTPAAAEAATPGKRKRVARKAAVVGADAENAPDSERPPEGEPEAEGGSTPAADTIEDDAPAPKKKVAKKAAPAPKVAAPKPAAAPKAPATKQPTRKGGAPKSTPLASKASAPRPSVAKAKPSRPVASKPAAPKPVAPKAVAAKPAAPKAAPAAKPKAPKKR